MANKNSGSWIFFFSRKYDIKLLCRIEDSCWKSPQESEPSSSNTWATEAVARGFNEHLHLSPLGRQQGGALPQHRYQWGDWGTNTTSSTSTFNSSTFQTISIPACNPEEASKDAKWGPCIREEEVMDGCTDIFYINLSRMYRAAKPNIYCSQNIDIFLQQSS